MNKLKNIVIIILLLMTNFLSAECVDSEGLAGQSCDNIINVFESISQPFVGSANIKLIKGMNENKI